MTSYNPPLHLVPFPVGIPIIFTRCAFSREERRASFSQCRAPSRTFAQVGWKKSPSLRDRISRKLSLKMNLCIEELVWRVDHFGSLMTISFENICFFVLISTTSGWREHCELRPTCSEKHLPGTSAKRSWDILKLIPPLYQHNFRKTDIIAHDKRVWELYPLTTQS